MKNKLHISYFLVEKCEDFSLYIGFAMGGSAAKPLLKLKAIGFVFLSMRLLLSMKLLEV